MAKQRKIFILYARFGEGHWQAATALRQSFMQQGNIDVRMIDLLAESHPVINGVSRYVYNKSYHVLPQVYGWVYEATKGMKSDSMFATWLHSFGAVTLRKLVAKERPDAIVHTFPILVLPFIMQKMGRKIPMYNVVTDFDLHLRWVHPDVDKYYVATDDISRQLCELGIQSQRVAATGIPIRSSFTNDTAVPSTQYRLHPHKPIILLMAAANMGGLDIALFCQKMILNGDIQVVIVCGRHQPLQKMLKDHFKTNSDVTVLGYVERIDELMSISSCMITKPGGLTLSEAITAELPLFLYRPVPGQERNNARYLQNKGAALICQTIEELLSAVKELFHKPGRRFEMLNALKALKKKSASDSIALDIVHQLHIMEEASASVSVSNQIEVPLKESYL
ncbi:MGDG synthase family glycosyltransferase [Cohnella mopanensis]|uniref:MGDG synthase family glycosyltransferase n=1 Tax=Cohnella mopanensis TaxID=2911966 RepID=UPI001EF7AA48|nr:glycosyltransferase [Cohnella mopanensis]